MRVISASQPFGMLIGLFSAFKARLTIPAVNTATTLVFALRNRAGRATTAAKPNQAVPGNKTPAAMSGDAQPTIQRGGTALKSIAPVAVQGRNATFRVQQINHGNDNTAAAANHSPTAIRRLDGQ